MFDEALIIDLKSDWRLANLVSQYMGQPAMFSDQAPEDAAVPYLVTRIERNEQSDNISVDDFDVFIDFYDIGPSAVNAREAMFQLDRILSQKSLSAPSERYDNIRFYRGRAGQIPDNTQSTTIHYNYQCQARAGRKGWMAYI